MIPLVKLVHPDGGDAEASINRKSAFLKRRWAFPVKPGYDQQMESCLSPLPQEAFKSWNAYSDGFSRFELFIGTGCSNSCGPCKATFQMSSCRSEDCIGSYLLARSIVKLVRRSGMQHTALYLKECASCLQRAYGGDKFTHDALPVPVSLNRSGYPTIGISS